MNSYIEERFIMEIINALWVAGAAALVILLLTYAAYCWRRDGFAAHVRLALGMAVVIAGAGGHQAVIQWWHHEVIRGYPITMESIYPALAMALVIAIGSTFFLIRVLSERFFGWPACATVMGAVVVTAAVLVVL